MKGVDSILQLQHLGVDWSQVCSYPALLSKQAVTRSVKQWGNDRWKAKWAGLTTSQQTKIWFPSIRGNFTSQIRKFNRHDLIHLIHFTTQHNFLPRHRQKLAGEGTDMCRLCGCSGGYPSSLGGLSGHTIREDGGGTSKGPILVPFTALQVP